MAATDQTNHLVDRWLEDTAERDLVNDRYRRQMQARRCRRGFRPAAEGKPDLATLTLEGPDAVIDRVWNQITNAADAVYQAAGGRDHLVGDHTPWEHRLFDAAISLFDDIAVGDSAAKRVASTPTRDSTPTSGTRPKAGSKPVAVVSITLDDLDVRPATQHGTGPIAVDLFMHYVATSPIYALFADSTGEPLWLGRTRRHVHRGPVLGPHGARWRLCTVRGPADNNPPGIGPR